MDEPMKLAILLRVMWAAWTINDYSVALVEWAQQKYSDELHGIGTVD